MPAKPALLPLSPSEPTPAPATADLLASDGFATVLEVARFLAVSRSQVYALLAAGKLVSATIGRSRRVPWRAVKQFAAEAITNGK
jgi:excisionase family DNA binding protein